MKTFRLLVCVLTILIFATTAWADYDQLIKQIDDTWFNRNADTRPMKDALKMAEQAYGENPGYEAAYRAALACFWICDRTEDRKVDLEFGKRGVEWAEKAIAADPTRVEGHFTYMVNLGEYGKGMSIVTALAKGLGGKFEASAKKTISLNPNYDHGSPFRAYGRYWFKLPWPKYSAKKAEANYMASLRIAPRASRSHFYLAELYIKEKQYDKARSVLRDQQALKSGYKDAAFEHMYFMKLGKDLLEDIKNK
jgi:tetratricopeptide (TPR) repeat protein